MKSQNYMKGSFFTKNELKRRLNKLGTFPTTNDKTSLNSLYDSALIDDDSKSVLHSELEKDRTFKWSKKEQKRSLNLIDEDEDEKEEKSVRLSPYDTKSVFSKPPGLVKKSSEQKKNMSFSINNNINVIESGGCLNKSEHSSSMSSGLVGFGLGAISTSGMYFIPLERIQGFSSSIHNLITRLGSYLHSMSVESIERARPIVSMVWSFINDIVNKINNDDIYTLLFIIFLVMMVLFIIKVGYKALRGRK